MKIVVNTETLLTEIPTSVKTFMIRNIPAFSMSSGREPSTLLMLSEAISFSLSYYLICKSIKFHIYLSDLIIIS